MTYMSQADHIARLRRLIEVCKEGWDLNGESPDMQEYRDMLDLLDGHEVPRRWWDA